MSKIPEGHCPYDECGECYDTGLVHKDCGSRVHTELEDDHPDYGIVLNYVCEKHGSVGGNDVE